MGFSIGFAFDDNLQFRNKFYFYNIIFLIICLYLMPFFKYLTFFLVNGSTIFGLMSNNGTSMKSLSNKPLCGIVSSLSPIISELCNKMSKSMVLGLNLKSLFLPSLFSISWSFFNNSCALSLVFIPTARLIK